MKHDEKNPDFMRALKQSGFAFDNRERHQALHFWNAGREHESNTDETKGIPPKNEGCSKCGALIVEICGGPACSGCGKKY